MNHQFITVIGKITGLSNFFPLYTNSKQELISVNQDN